MSLNFPPTCPIKPYVYTQTDITLFANSSNFEPKSRTLIFCGQCSAIPDKFRLFLFGGALRQIGIDQGLVGHIHLFSQVFEIFNRGFVQTNGDLQNPIHFPSRKDVCEHAPAGRP